MRHATLMAMGLVLGAGAWGWADGAGGGCCGGGMAGCPMVKATTQPTTRPAGAYVCPMGDETSDKPGRCSKCGMDLVPQTPKTDGGDAQAH